MKQILIYIFLVLFSCCTKKQEIPNNGTSVIDQKDSLMTNNIQKDSLVLLDINIIELEDAVREKGDTLAYERLVTFYLDSEKLLPSSIIMADKYDYSSAKYMTSLILMRVVYPKKKDKIIMEKGLNYLHRAAEQGEKNACRDLGFYYFKGEYVKKDTVLGKEYLQKVGIDIDKPLRSGSAMTFRNTHLK